jgi:hypothetical protein
LRCSTSKSNNVRRNQITTAIVVVY